MDSYRVDSGFLICTEKLSSQSNGCPYGYQLLSCSASDGGDTFVLGEVFNDFFWGHFET